MRMLVLVQACAVALAGCSISGCGTPHAVRVRCDRHLSPINSAASRAAASSSSEPKAPAAERRDGA